MRVLMVAANQEQTPDPVVPLGCLLVAEAARRAGHAVSLYDACFDGEQFPARLAAAITQHNPEVIGLSLRNVDDVAWPTAHSYLDHYRRCVEVIRATAPTARLVLGGSAFNLFPEQFLATLGADHGIHGAGEHAFPALLSALAAGETVPRLMRTSEIMPDVLMPPAWDLIDVQTYLRLGGSINLQTKRGCSLACTYCTYPSLEGRQVLARPSAVAVDQIEHAWRTWGADHVFIVDNVFNRPAATALEFCHTLAARRLPVRWSAYVNPGGLTQELVEAMAASGCSGVDLGVDAAHPTTLRALRKGFTVENLRFAANAFRAAQVKVAASLILGGPAETWETLHATVAEIEALEPNAVFALMGVRLYPGTPLVQQLAAEGAVDPASIGLTPVFYVAEAVRDGLVEWAQKQIQRKRSWFFPGLRDPRLEVVRAWARAGGTRGPLWELSPPEAKRPRARSGVASQEKT